MNLLIAAGKKNSNDLGSISFGGRQRRQFGRRRSMNLNGVPAMLHLIGNREIAGRQKWYFLTIGQLKLQEYSLSYRVLISGI
jgi:hypothetical protein